VKIAVIGAEGQVGHFLRQGLAARHQVVGTSLDGRDNLHPLDIRDAAAVRDFLRTQAPEYVILTAALTHVDLCEERPEEAEAINVRGTEHVAETCRQLGAGLAFFSSEYVFDGRSGPYAEADDPAPASVYGRTKLAGERIVAERVDNHLIIRTTVVFSYLAGSMNFFMQVLERAQKDQVLRVPRDQYSNPTQAVNLAGALGELIETGKRGVYHLVGLDRLQRADFACRILRALDHDCGRVQPVTTAELGQKAPRPLAAGLKTDKARSVLQAHPLWDLDTALRFTLSQMRGRES